MYLYFSNRNWPSGLLLSLPKHGRLICHHLHKLWANLWLQLPGKSSMKKYLKKQENNEFSMCSIKNWSKWSSNNNMAYILFHNCSWAVLSILRYFYIVKKDWLLQKLSERQLIVMSMSFIVALFSISCACFVAIFVYINFNFSSPEKNPVTELSDDVKIKAITY